MSPRINARRLEVYFYRDVCSYARNVKLRARFIALVNVIANVISYTGGVSSFSCLFYSFVYAYEINLQQHYDDGNYANVN